MRSLLGISGELLLQGKSLLLYCTKYLSYYYCMMEFIIIIINNVVYLYSIIFTVVVVVLMRTSWRLQARWTSRQQAAEVPARRTRAQWPTRTAVSLRPDSRPPEERPQLLLLRRSRSAGDIKQYCPIMVGLIASSRELLEWYSVFVIIRWDIKCIYLFNVNFKSIQLLLQFINTYS